MTVDDPIRYSAARIEECHMYYLADIIGIEEGSETQIADCWTNVDAFNEFVPDFRAGMEPFLVEDHNEESEDLVNGSYSSLLGWGNRSPGVQKHLRLSVRGVHGLHDEGRGHRRDVGGRRHG
ncbi:MAG: hypothetical protein JWQ59_1946 [Cryobacterium sp.]|nr:hypothetical protein [Cryobacterium sp.]